MRFALVLVATALTSSLAAAQDGRDGSQGPPTEEELRVGAYLPLALAIAAIVLLAALVWGALRRHRRHALRRS